MSNDSAVNSVKAWQGKVERAKIEISDFTVDLENDPVFALGWSGGVFGSAATVKVYGNAAIIYGDFIESGIDPQAAYNAAIEHMNGSLIEAARDMNIYNSNPMKGFMHQHYVEKLARFCEDWKPL